MLYCLAYLDARPCATWLAASCSRMVQLLPALLTSREAYRAEDLEWAVSELDANAGCHGAVSRPFLASLARQTTLLQQQQQQQRSGGSGDESDGQQGGGGEGGRSSPGRQRPRPLGGGGSGAGRSGAVVEVGLEVQHEGCGTGGSVGTVGRVGGGIGLRLRRAGLGLGFRLLQRGSGTGR